MGTINTERTPTADGLPSDPEKDLVTLSAKLDEQQTLIEGIIAGDDAQKGTLLKEELLKAFSMVRDKSILGKETLGTSAERQQARDEAARRFSSVQDTIRAYVNDYENPNFHPRELLEDYHVGYRNLLEGCPDVDTIKKDNSDGPDCSDLSRWDASFVQMIQLGFNDQRLSFFEWLHRHGRLSPFLFYSSSGDRSGVGIGGAAEVLVDLKDEPIVFGAETRLLMDSTFDDTNPFEGEIKTVDIQYMVPLLEAGYQNDHLMVVAQGGFWFSKYKLTPERQALTPYSENLFKNPNYQVGVKTVLRNPSLSLAAGYQRSPWGPGGYGQIGYTFGGKQ